MFTPTSKVKKLLAQYGSTAYVHRDGVVVLERKEIKVAGGNTTQIDVWHIIPCEIPIYVRDWTKYGTEYTSSNKTKVNRLVIHNPKLIANGFDSVEVNFNTSSDSSKEKGLCINSVKFTQGFHEWDDTSIERVYGSSVTIQPNPYTAYSSDGDASIHNYTDYSWRNGNSVVIHGEMPVKVEEILQLTVSQ